MSEKRDKYWNRDFIAQVSVNGSACICFTQKQLNDIVYEARRDTVEWISVNEGWEESRDYYLNLIPRPDDHE